jgi:branched-chain amino acid transport system substrate-binding protein
MLRALALCLSLALAACVAAPQPPGAAAPGAPPPHIAILVPLSGPHSEVGPALVNGAWLALDGPGAPILDVFDTHGTPGGSAEAARQAVAAGDAVMLGPLTASDTAAAAPIALSAGIPVLAFTNDTTQSHPGVWTMGITPGQQVRRLVQILRDRGRTRIAGLLPHSDFGQAMEQGLTESAAEFGLPPPSVREYAPLPSSIGDALNELESHTAPTIASFGSPPPSPLPPPPPLSSGPETPPAQAAAPAPPPLPAAFPFDALLLADTGGGLALVAAQLSKTGVHQPDVQIVGPALWASTSPASMPTAAAMPCSPASGATSSRASAPEWSRRPRCCWPTAPG